MKNETAIEHTFKKNERVTPIETNSTVTIDEESVPVDTQFLFQRFVDKPAEVFTYISCAVSPQYYLNRHL